MSMPRITPCQYCGSPPTLGISLVEKQPEPMDLVEVANSIAETIAKVTAPLTDEQRTYLAAAIGPWLDRASQRREVK